MLRQFFAIFHNSTIEMPTILYCSNPHNCYRNFRKHTTCRRKCYRFVHIFFIISIVSELLNFSCGLE